MILILSFRKNVQSPLHNNRCCPFTLRCGEDWWYLCSFLLSKVVLHSPSNFLIKLGYCCQYHHHHHPTQHRLDFLCAVHQWDVLVILRWSSDRFSPLVNPFRFSFFISVAICFIPGSLYSPRFKPPLYYYLQDFALKHVLRTYAPEEWQIIQVTHMLCLA